MGLSFLNRCICEVTCRRHKGGRDSSSHEVGRVKKGG